jgi:hypothetical protein
MKRIIIALTLFTIIFHSDSFAQRNRVTPLGKWRLVSVNIEGDKTASLSATPVFEDATSACYTGSEWSLAPKDEGVYTVESSEACKTGRRKINWRMMGLNGSNYFQFQRFDAVNGVAADKYTVYTMQLTSLTEDAMVMKYPVLYNGKNSTFVFNFTRTDKRW